MADYINRELLLEDLETSIVVSGRTDVAPLELRGVHKVVDRIKAMPTEDVQEVKHSNAILVINKEKHGECKLVYNCCGIVIPSELDYHRYCPNCGARMDGDVE